MGDDELAAYIDHELDDDVRARIEAHLAECDDCRRMLVVAALALPDGAEAARRRNKAMWRWSGAIGFAAAAAILFFVVPRMRDGGSITSEQRTRDGGGLVGDDTPRVVMESPDAGARVKLDTVVFRWSAAAPDASYQLTISDSAGGVVWSTPAIGTSAVLPDSVLRTMRIGANYFWRVDVMLPDLRSTTTAPRAFVPTPERR